MTQIDIDALSEPELRTLHHRMTERLRFLTQLRAHSAMLEFALGDRVAFNADGRQVIGVITRYNRKTVTLIADDGARWNVSPSLLKRIEPPPAYSADPTRVVVQPAGAWPNGPGELTRFGQSR